LYDFFSSWCVSPWQCFRINWRNLYNYKAMLTSLQLWHAFWAITSITSKSYVQESQIHIWTCLLCGYIPCELSHGRMITHLFPGAGFSLHFSMQCYLQRWGSIDLSHHYRPAISCWRKFSGIETSIANIRKCTMHVLHAILCEWSAAWLKFVHKSWFDIRGFSQVNLDKLQLHKCAMQTLLLWHMVT
jgi:hypothetical protein